MSEEITSPATRAAFSVGLIILGIVFIFVWLALAVGLGVMMLMPALMVNDSNRLSSDQHLGVMTGMYGGLLLLGLAGVPAGLAFFWRGCRGRLLGIFVGLLGSGLLVEIITFYRLS